MEEHLVDDLLGDGMGWVRNLYSAITGEHPPDFVLDGSPVSALLLVPLSPPQSWQQPDIHFASKRKKDLSIADGLPAQPNFWWWNLIFDS